MYLQDKRLLFPIPPLISTHFCQRTSLTEKAPQNQTRDSINPSLSVVIRSQPKGDMSACVRIDQKSGTKKPDLLSQTRSKLVEVTGFEPATFWSRKLTLFDQCESDYPSLSTIDRICSDRKAPSVGEFEWQTTRLKEPAVMDNRFVISHRFSCSIPRVRCHA